MQLPFTVEDFLDVFTNYNLAVFPAQVLLNILAVVIIVLSIWKSKHSNTITGVILSFLWLWTGGVYHLIFFSRINPVAKVFGVSFILQGLIFLYFLSIQNRFSFKFTRDFKGITGAIFIFYALVVYPMLGLLFGHTYPANPTFGLPCPTTIFTFGLLLWSEERLPFYLYIIPFLWSLLGFSAALKLGILEDTGLLIAGLAGTMILLFWNRKKTQLARL
ncbi:MAG: DUF6064 family protein [Bacteroidota bacterium]|nr:DUF6064 family protein [Bacteroidota bacterium]MDP4196670.1 DUF6064 family protein [Bacteroidota bacterium]